MNIEILGGGISGLAAAYFLRQKYPAARIVLREKENRLGGCIETRQCGPFRFEMGPRTFPFSRCPAMLSLIRDLGLGQDLIASSAKTRYLWHRGKLRPLGSFWPQIFAAIVRDLAMPKGEHREESLYAFAARRFGKRAAELFFDPLAKGVFGGSSKELSLDACFPALRTWEQTHRSIVCAALRQKKSEAPRGLFTLRGGMGRLIEALAQAPDEIHLGCSVTEMPEADLVVSALPAEAAARLCGIDLQIPHRSFSVVSMGFEGDVLPLSGYGYLVPSLEQEKVLGQIWDSSVFPEKGQTKLTTMVDGGETEALEALQRHLGIARLPDAICVKKALIPQYAIGHQKKISAFEAEAKSRFERLILIGNYLGGSSVESCIQKIKIFITT